MVRRDAFIHDFACAPGDHSAALSANDGGIKIEVVHNNLDIHSGCETAAWEIAKDFGNYDDVLTEKNLFNGGAYCAYAAVEIPGDSYPQATNIRFIDNVFGRKYEAECGQYGPIAQWGSKGGSVWRNNTWGDGAKATAAHKTGDPIAP